MEKLGEDIVKQFNLPGYIKGKSFADASKLIDNKFKDRTDKTSKETKEELLSRLAEAQEYVRQVNESVANNSQEVPDMMGGTPEGMDQFMDASDQFELGGIMPQPDNANPNEQMASMIVNALQEGAQPQEILDSLVNEAGVPEEEAMQMIQQVISQQQGEQPMQEDIAAPQQAMEGPQMFELGGRLDPPNNKLSPFAYSVFTGNPAEVAFVKNDMHDFFTPGTTNFNSANTNKETMDQHLDRMRPIYDSLVKRGYRFDEFKGNYKNKKENGGFLTTDWLKSNKEAIAGITGNIGNVASLGSSIFGSDGIDTSGASGRQEVVNEGARAANTALSGASTGASIGGSILPGVGHAVGAVGGALFGGIGSLLGSGSRRRKVREANINSMLADNAQFDNKFELGGNLGTRKKVNPVESFDPTIDLTNGIAPNLPTGFTPNAPQASEPSRFSQIAGKAGSWLDRNKFDIGRLAPVAFNLFDKVKSPTQRLSPRLDNRYEKTPFDVETIANNLRQNNIPRAIQESSGGNVGAARHNLVAAGLNRDKALSNAFVQADQINRAENARAQQFNLGIDQFNTQATERDIERADRNEGAVNTAKAMRNASIAESIGNIAKELSQDELAKDLFGYRRDGSYVVNDETGERLTAKEFNDKYNDIYKELLEKYPNLKGSGEAKDIFSILDRAKGAVQSATDNLQTNTSDSADLNIDDIRQHLNDNINIKTSDGEAKDFSSTDPGLAKYIYDLPKNIQDLITLTSATGGPNDKRVNPKAHTSGKALDLRFNQELYDYLVNDPKLKELGIKIPNPNHGTGKHIHIEIS